MCHRCGAKISDKYDVHISICHQSSYEFSQDFNLCVYCKDIFLDRISIVISNCKMNDPKEKPKIVSKKKPKSKKNNK